jgi:hypothetical protein
MKISGTFTSTCPDHLPNYCAGYMSLELDQDLRQNLSYLTGKLQITYTGTFRPKMPFPNPLPSLPIEVKRQADGSYEIGIRTSWYRFWEKALLKVGISVHVDPINDLKKITAKYNVNGLRGLLGIAEIPRDWGTCSATIL